MRGVGQTTNLIYNLPNERCIVVTHSASTGRLIQNLIKEIRGKDFSKKVKVISISDNEDLCKLMGISHLVFFDHAFFDSSSEEIAKKALSYSHSAAIVYHTQKGNLK